MLGLTRQDKIFVYTKKHNKGEIPEDVTHTEVIESLKNYFRDFNINVIYKSNTYCVTVTPKNNRAKNTLKKLGVLRFLFPRLKFCYSVGQSVMFRVNISKVETYSNYKDLFDDIATDMKLDILEPFPEDSITLSRS